MICCIMLTVKPLSEAASEALMEAAIRMLCTGRRKMSVNHDDVEGVVMTSFETRSLGDIAGVAFEAFVKTDKGSTNVKFLLPPGTDGMPEDAGCVEGFFVKLTALPCPIHDQRPNHPMASIN